MSVVRRWPRLMRVAAGVLAALLAAGPPLAGWARDDGDAPGGERAEVRLYDISDLIGPNPAPPNQALVPAGWYSMPVEVEGTPFTHSLYPSSADWLWLRRGSVESVLLRRLLAGVLAGDAGADRFTLPLFPPVRRMGNVLVVTTTPEKHRRVEALLAEFRRAQWARRTYHVRAWWVTLTGEQRAAILPGLTLGQSQCALTRKGLARLAPHVICRAEGSVLEGQTAQWMSGRAAGGIFGTEALCSETNAMRIRAVWQLYGQGLQVRVEQSNSTSDVQVCLRAAAGEYLGGRVTDAMRHRARQAGMALNDLDLPRDLRTPVRTSLSMPLGRPVVVAAMSCPVPGGGAPDSTLCLILELSLPRPGAPGEGKVE